MQPENEQLQARMVELASERRRFGYRRIHALLRREGIEVNHKRIFRLYQAAGLAVARRRKRCSVAVERSQLALPSLPMAKARDLPELAPQELRAYTDLLLHDLGESLADGRPSFEAEGREWRTPPLWGIGLVQQVNQHQNFLHDGRARGFVEAILWHGGEAEAARLAFLQLARAERQRVVRFLESL